MKIDFRKAREKLRNIDFRKAYEELKDLRIRLDLPDKIVLSTLVTASVVDLVATIASIRTKTSSYIDVYENKGWDAVNYLFSSMEENPFIKNLINQYGLEGGVIIGHGIKMVGYLGNAALLYLVLNNRLVGKLFDKIITEDSSKPYISVFGRKFEKDKVLSLAKKSFAYTYLLMASAQHFSGAISWFPYI